MNELKINEWKEVYIFIPRENNTIKSFQCDVITICILFCISLKKRDCIKNTNKRQLKYLFKKNLNKKEIETK